MQILGRETSQSGLFSLRQYVQSTEHPSDDELGTQKHKNLAAGLERIGKFVNSTNGFRIC